MIILEAGDVLFYDLLENWKNWLIGYVNSLAFYGVDLF